MCFSTLLACRFSALAVSFFDPLFFCLSVPANFVIRLGFCEPTRVLVVKVLAIVLNSLVHAEPSPTNFSRFKAEFKYSLVFKNKLDGYQICIQFELIFLLNLIEFGYPHRLYRG